MLNVVCWISLLTIRSIIEDATRDSMIRELFDATLATTQHDKDFEPTMKNYCLGV